MSFKDNSYNLVLIVFIIYALIKYIWLPSNSAEVFQISRNHIKYHANWTQSLSNLKQLENFHEALKIDGIKELDVSLAMSDFNITQIRTIFPFPLMSYEKIKINVGNLDLSTSGAEYILNQIPRNVKELQLYFDSIGANNHLGQVLAIKLNQMKSIKKLKLSLILSSVQDQGFYDFFAGHNPQKLQKLDLVFIGNKINSTGVKNIQPYMKKCVNVKDFTLNLYANNIMSEGAEYLAAGLQHIRAYTEKLYIDLYFNNVTQIGTKAITEKVQQFESIQNLELNFDFNYIKNEGGKYIGNMLKNLRKLESLNIGVASKNFGYLGFKSLIQGLNQQTQLTQLSLRCGVNRVGVNGANIVSDMLKKIGQNIRKLHLGFIENYIGDDGLKSLTETINKQLPLIQDLSIDLAFNDAKGFGGIAALKNIAERKYKNLDLRLSHNQFRDYDVKLMLPHLKQIVKDFQLEKSGTFVFDFMETAISKKMMNQIKSIFANTNKQKVKLYINSVIEQQEQQSNTAEQKVKGSSQKSQQKQNNQNMDEKKAKLQTENKAKQQAEKKAKQEAEKKAKQEAQKKAKQEAEKKAKQEAEKKAKQQAEKKAKQQAEKKEAEKKAKQEAEKKAKQEADNKAKQQAEKKEAEKKAKQEAEKKAKQQAEKKAKQQAEKKAKQQAEKKAKQQAEKKEAEKKAKQEADNKAKQQAEKKEAEKKAKQEAEKKAKQQAEKKAKQQTDNKAKQQAEKKEAEKKAKQQADNKAKQQAEKKEAKQEAEKKAKQQAEKKAKQQAKKKAKQQAEKKEAEKKAKQQADNKAKQQAEKKEAEKKAKQQADNKAKQQAEKKEAQNKAKQEAEKKAKQQAEKKANKEEADKKSQKNKQQKEGAINDL